MSWNKGDPTTSGPVTSDPGTLDSERRFQAVARTIRQVETFDEFTNSVSRA